ncbi:MAG: hypothetical protein WBO17_09960, partial [Sphingorhabdus sp.]
IDPEPKQTLINRAVADGLYNEAVRLSNRPIQNTNIYNGKFEIEPSYPPFDWVLSRDAELGSERVGQSEGRQSHRLYLSAGSGRSGILAKQLLMLKPGTYDLNAEVSSVPASIPDRPFLRLRCAGNIETVIANADFPQANAAPEVLNLAIRVPPEGCAAQWLEISAKASRQIGGTQSYLESISISRIALRN